MIRGSGLALIGDLLKGADHDQATQTFQEMVLRMLGLSVDESHDVAVKARERLLSGIN